ncbi:hypothetical protein [Stutzerimonas balearica]|uniref:hypothetical protein n=1 Tax=Stutzerimonas balearica TaxID=74829 RepID=UPI0022AEB3ED|nr:hypothetical protein [Stutzerimonas balearica]MCZ4129589.1 hypothetical protein [Stutzerimonas balearica]
MDWNDWITNAMAFTALFISWKGFKHTQRVAKDNAEHKQRIEQLEHFPIVTVSVAPVDDRVKVRLINTSPKNCVSAYQMAFVLRISSNEGRFSLDENNLYIKGGVIAPNKSIDIDTSQINAQIALFLPLLRNCSPSEYNFVVRATATCTPPHHGSEKVIASGVALFSYEDGKLLLRPESANAV